MTHKELVERAHKWLQRRCGVVCCEVVSYAPEIPDAIGFSHHRSIAVECKASRADFLRDKKKAHRALMGMGTLRYYMCPPGMIKSEELPMNWGLLYCHGRKVEIVKEAVAQDSDTYSLMYSLLRRAVVRGFDPSERLKP